MSTFNSQQFNAVPFNGASLGAPAEFLSVDDRTFDLAQYGMTKVGVKLKNWTVGDDKQIKRTYTGLQSGVTVTLGWLTLKKKEKDPDSAALIQKPILSTTSSHGRITDFYSASGQIAMYFNVLRADIVSAKPGVEYVYDIQVKTSSGAIHTLEKGTISFIRGVTEASS